jgi:dTDP-glucose 4,6-dehydratase
VNIGSPHELSVLELAEAVRDLVGSGSPIEFVPRPQDDPTLRRPDITVAREKLGWEPVVGLGEGLARTIEWFRGLDLLDTTRTPEDLALSVSPSTGGR